MLTPNNYQAQARQYAVFPLEDSGWDYLLSALPEEVGEFSSIFAKAARRGRGRALTQEERKHAVKELGDIQWMLALCAHLLSASLETVMSDNLNKLEERKRTNTIEGSGETIAERLV